MNVFCKTHKGQGGFTWGDFVSCEKLKYQIHALYILLVMNFRTEDLVLHSTFVHNIYRHLKQQCYNCISERTPNRYVFVHNAQRLSKINVPKLCHL